MGWIVKSNPELVDAIVASFGDPPERSQERFRAFKTKEWMRTECWLDTSGLALYFLAHLRSRQIPNAIDPWMLDKLEQKLADNQVRTTGMLREFAVLNRAFQQAGVCYANLKGFTLAPASYPDLFLRYQSDIDFLVDPKHLNLAQAVLERHGYVLTGSTTRTLEFKCGSARKISRHGQYLATSPRQVELHLAIDGTDLTAGKVARDERLERLVEWRLDEHSYPALANSDQLIGQALHLLGHFRGEHTRPSWLLEYRRNVLSHREDAHFWEETRTLAERHQRAAGALGLSTRIASELFGPFSCEALDSWTVDVLPPKVSSWAGRFGRKAMLADVPGTKLYLLLDQALEESYPSARLQNRTRRLIPLRLPRPVLQPGPHDTIPQRLHRGMVQIQFLWYRFRFHLKQGVLLAIEGRRWQRLLKEEKSPFHKPGQRITTLKTSPQKCSQTCDDT
jgi:Uncharacterised nucleotidyltransferase